MKTPEECQKAKDELTAHRGLEKLLFSLKNGKKKKRLMVCPQQTREDGFSI